jgi:hypothetical protein
MQMSGFILWIGRFTSCRMSPTNIQEAVWVKATNKHAVTKEKLSALPEIEPQFSLNLVLSSVFAI